MELGGYFELEKNEDKSYHSNAVRLNSGRNCLRVLIRSRKIERIYLPYYICNAVVEACQLEGCKILFYFLGQDFKVKKEIEGFDANRDYLYLVNYFGVLSIDDILAFKRRYKNIVVDNTQAFFMQQVENIDTIYTCRKFFGVPDGAYLYTDSEIEGKYECDYSYDRMAHILGRFELGGEKFYELYIENEEKFSAMPIRYMSKLTDNLMSIIDYDKSKGRRTSNYCLLYRRLQQLNKLNLPEKIDGAFAYPLLIYNAKQIRMKLIEAKIFIPQYWKEVLDRVGERTIEFLFVQNILWLPCDQRYGEKEMDYLAGKLLSLLELTC